MIVGALLGEASRWAVVGFDLAIASSISPLSELLWISHDGLPLLQSFPLEYFHKRGAAKQKWWNTISRK